MVFVTIFGIPIHTYLVLIDPNERHENICFKLAGGSDRIMIADIFSFWILGKIKAIDPIYSDFLT